MAEVRTHIVIVGKEVQVLQFLEGRFSGFVVSKASAVAEGIEIIDKLKPLAVILDADGTTAEVVSQVEQLKKASAGALIWVLCPKADFGLAKKSLLAGAVGYIFKPYSVGDWEKVIHKITKANVTPEENELARMEALKSLSDSREKISGSEMGVFRQTEAVQKIGSITKEKAILGGIGVCKKLCVKGV